MVLVILFMCILGLMAVKMVGRDAFKGVDGLVNIGSAMIGLIFSPYILLPALFLVGGFALGGFLFLIDCFKKKEYKKGILWLIGGLVLQAVCWWIILN